MNKPLVMLLAGGGGTRLGVLVSHRSKPAVPFAGSYRIIDFALSNVMQAGLDWVGVLTQYKPLSLMSHIGSGKPWNFHGRRRGVRILPPRTGTAASDWYRGTADAIWQSMDFMEPLRPERVLILSGDHIYHMDYRKMLEDHLDAGADVTLAVMGVEARDTRRFGMVHVDEAGWVKRFEEKPQTTDSRLASMGIYLFEWPCLREALATCIGRSGGSDFGKDVMPALLGNRKMWTHRFSGYWRDVGTISSYFEANMDAFRAGSGLDLDTWETCTRIDSDLPGDLPPSGFGPAAACRQVLAAGGCRIGGEVQRTVLSPEVRIGAGARVENSILMNGVVVEPGAQIRCAILDKKVRVGRGAVIDGREGGQAGVVNARYAKCDLDGIVVIGAGAEVPSGTRLGHDVVLESGVGAEDFAGDVPPGQTIEKSTRS